MALTNAQKKVALDAGLASVTQVQWYEGTAGNETNATAKVARTAVTLTAPTAANPYIKSNNAALESAGCAAGGATITAFGFCLADNTVVSGPTRLDEAVPLNENGKITVVENGLKEQLENA